MGVRVPPFAYLSPFLMLKLIFLFLFLAAPLCAERITMDPASRNYKMGPLQKERVDVFDFAGFFPRLENIDVDARKKKNVDFQLTGDYPILEKISYEGAFGTLSGALTGRFPKLTLINFVCANTGVKLDLKARWTQSCTINVSGGNKDIALILPKDVGLVIHTKTGVKGKVIVSENLKSKKRWYNILNKTYQNDLAETSPIVLTICVESIDGRITLN